MYSLYLFFYYIYFYISPLFMIIVLHTSGHLPRESGVLLFFLFRFQADCQLSEVSNPFFSQPEQRIVSPWRNSDADGTQRLDDSYHARIINFKRVASVFPTFYYSSMPLFKTWLMRSMHYAKKMRVIASSFSCSH